MTIENFIDLVINWFCILGYKVKTTLINLYSYKFELENSNQSLIIKINHPLTSEKELVIDDSGLVLTNIEYYIFDKNKNSSSKLIDLEIRLDSETSYIYSSIGRGCRLEDGFAKRPVSLFLDNLKYSFNRELLSYTSNTVTILTKIVKCLDNNNQLSDLEIIQNYQKYLKDIPVLEGGSRDWKKIFDFYQLISL